MPRNPDLDLDLIDSKHCLERGQYLNLDLDLMTNQNMAMNGVNTQRILMILVPIDSPDAQLFNEAKIIKIR